MFERSVFATDRAALKHENKNLPKRERPLYWFHQSTKKNMLAAFLSHHLKTIDASYKTSNEVRLGDPTKSISTSFLLQELGKMSGCEDGRRQNLKPQRPGARRNIFFKGVSLQETRKATVAPITYITPKIQTLWYI